MRKFYKTVITVTVLSEEDTSEMDVGDILDASDTGNMVGVSCKDCCEISKDLCAELLKDFGSEPEFFDIGTDEDEDDEESEEET
jgi:hypothetical protein